MKLKSFYGNEIINTDDKRKIERLKEQGFTEIKEKTENKRVKKDGNKKETE